MRDVDELGFEGVDAVAAVSCVSLQVALAGWQPEVSSMPRDGRGAVPDDIAGDDEVLVGGDGGGEILKASGPRKGARDVELRVHRLAGAGL